MSPGPLVDSRYGTGAGRIPGATGWVADRDHPFRVSDRTDCVVLDLPHGRPWAWMRMPIPEPIGPIVWVVARVRCVSEMRGPSLVFGLEGDGRSMLVRQGGFTVSYHDFGPYGRPDSEGRGIPGFEPNDWHDLAVRYQPQTGDVRAFLDDVEIARFEVDAQAGRDALWLVIGSERPGQRIELDRIWVAGTLPALSGELLRPGLDADWELTGARPWVGRLRRRGKAPVLGPGPDGSADAGAAYDAWVMRDGAQFRMWYTARAGGAGQPSSIHHAISSDGVRWERTGEVLAPGDASGWDGGGLQSPVVLRTSRGYRLWYAGYLVGHREARVGVADFEDGIHWVRPRLRTGTFDGIPTNIVYDLQDQRDDSQYVMPQCVVHDPDAPAHRRWVLFVHAQGKYCHIQVAWSEDGLHFERRIPSSRRFAVEASRPRDGLLHQRTSIIREGDRWTAFFGHITVGPPLALTTWMTSWRMDPAADEPPYGLWRATPQLLTVPGTWESGFVWPNCATVGGETWDLYYTGSAGPFSGAVGVASVRAGRLWAIVADGSGQGSAQTRPFSQPSDGWADRTLWVDVDSRRGRGRAIVGLRTAAGAAIPGFGVDDHVPLHGNGWQQVAWAAGGALPDLDEDLAVEVRLDGRARLYGIQFRKRAPSAAPGAST